MALRAVFPVWFVYKKFLSLGGRADLEEEEWLIVFIFIN